MHVAGSSLARPRRSLERKLGVGPRALAEHRIRTRLRLPISPLWIERDITLTGRTVQFDYQLRNLSDERFEYLWAFHPLLRLTPAAAFLPASCRSVRTKCVWAVAPSGAAATNGLGPSLCRALTFRASTSAATDER